MQNLSSFVDSFELQVENLNSRLKSLERELSIHKSENERLARENQALKRSYHSGSRK